MFPLPFIVPVLTALSLFFAWRAAFFVRASMELAPTQLTISQHTTRLTAPLREDGTVNYAAVYRPQRDALPDLLRAAELARNWRRDVRHPGQAATYCAAHPDAPFVRELLADDNRSLAALERAAQADFPEVAPWVRSRVAALLGVAGVDGFVQPNVVSVAEPIRAAGCRCGVEASRGTAGVHRRIEMLIALSGVLGAAKEVLMLTLSELPLQEANACAALLEERGDAEELAQVVLPPPRSWTLTEYVEGRRLRVLDAATGSLDRRCRKDIDVNLLLTRLNSYFDRHAQLDESAQMALVVEAHRSLTFAAKLNPLVSLTELRRRRTEYAAVSIYFLVMPALLRDPKRRSEEYGQLADTLMRARTDAAAK